jgi:WD40 repeat protein
VGRDQYGDPLPRGAVMRLGTVRLRHSSVLLRFSPDGKVLVSVGDGGMKVWDAQTGKEIPWPVVGRVEAAAFSPDGKTLGLVVRDRAKPDWDPIRCLQHWDVQTRKILRPAVTITTVSRYADQSYVCFTDDARALVYSDRFRGTSVWTDKGERKLDIDADVSHQDPAALSPDGRLLALCAGQEVLTLYDVTTKRKLRDLRSENAQEYSLHPQFSQPQFSPDGRRLIARVDGVIHLFDVKSGKLLHEADVRSNSCAYSPDGKQIASLGGNVIRLLDARTLRMSRSFPAPGTRWGSGVTFSADGKRLAVGGHRSLSIWDVATGRNLTDFMGHRELVNALKFSDDGRQLATGGEDGAACVWDLNTGRMTHRFEGHHWSAPGLALSPDGKTLATGEGHPWIGEHFVEAQIRLFDLTQGKLARQFTGHLEGVRWLRFSPDGKRLASGGWDDRLRLWDAATGRRLWQVRHALWRPICFLDGGKSLLIHDGKEQYAIHDATTGESRAAPPAGRRHPDSGRLLEWPKKNKDRITDEAFTHDGETIARGVDPRGEGPIELIDLNTTAPFARLDADHGVQSALAFSPDGRRLATGGSDTAVLIWDVARLRIEHLCDKLLAGDSDARYKKFATDVTAEMRRRLHALAEAEARACAHLRDLDDDDFDVRQRAEQALERMGAMAVPVLKQLLEDRPSSEVRMRATRLLVRLGAKKDTHLRLSRGLPILAGLGQPARRLLEELSRGDKELAVTKAARQALQEKGGDK